MKNGAISVVPRVSKSPVPLEDLAHHVRSAVSSHTFKLLLLREGKESRLALHLGIETQALYRTLLQSLEAWGELKPHIIILVQVIEENKNK